MSTDIAGHNWYNALRQHPVFPKVGKVIFKLFHWQTRNRPLVGSVLIWLFQEQCRLARDTPGTPHVTGAQQSSKEREVWGWPYLNPQWGEALRFHRAKDLMVSLLAFIQKCFSYRPIDSWINIEKKLRLELLFFSFSEVCRPCEAKMTVSNGWN